MKWRSKWNVFLALLMFSFSDISLDAFKYRRHIIGVVNEWHKLELPDEIFSKVEPDMRDIRIVGVSNSKDTLNAPYFLKVSESSTRHNSVDFKFLNNTKNEMGTYFTFEVPETETINRLQLNFAQTNFDWQVQLEGSHDQRNWFSIIDDYRILSIRNRNTDYAFTTLVFPDTKYSYYRLLLKTKDKPELVSASLEKDSIVEAEYRSYSDLNFSVVENKTLAQTEIDIDLPSPVPVCYLRLHILDTIDYYRTATLKYLTDSVKSPKGWHYNYAILTTGTITSMDSATFSFDGTVTGKLKLIIENHDDQPLTISSIDAKRYVYNLFIRFPGAADYHLVYGNARVSIPEFDLNHFVQDIPNKLTPVTLDSEITSDVSDEKQVTPLFQNRFWLWTVMGIIILLLGWFSMKLIKSKQ